MTQVHQEGSPSTSGPDSPPIGKENVPVWIQDEWSNTLRTVVEEAQQAGAESPTVFVFVPRLEADELRQTIARLEGARETLSTKPTPTTGGGAEARAAMQFRFETEEHRLNNLVDNIVRRSRIYQGGGQ